MNELTISNAGSIVPVTDVHAALQRYQSMKDFIDSVLKKDVDFGVIPGTNKPTLLKPGAEKLAYFFGLKPRFVLVHDIENWDVEPPLFYYHYKCILERNGEMAGEGEGSCNSREKKYRYRQAERVCPTCGKSTIIKGKAEYGGGYVCFAKKGGCGAKFGDNDPAITSQQLGQVENPDVFDLVNTIQKMAQKRAYVAAVLIAVNGSEYFTQDVEDYIQGDFHETADNPATSTPGKTTPPTGAAKPRPAAPAPAAKAPAKEKLTRPIPADKLIAQIEGRAETLKSSPADPDAAGKIATAMTNALASFGVDDYEIYTRVLHMITGAYAPEDLTSGAQLSLLAWLSPDDEWYPSDMAIQELKLFWDKIAQKTLQGE